MNFRKVHLAALIAVAMFVSSSCSSEDDGVLGNINTDRSREIKELISSELEIGSSSDDIESFFTRHKIAFTFDRFAQRYQAIIRDVATDPKSDQAVVIYIEVDDTGRFVNSEVKDSFTAP